MRDIDYLFRKGAPDIYLNPPYMVLDFEATGYSAIDPKTDIVLACWWVVQENGVILEKFEWGDELTLKELQRDVKNVNFVVAQNAKYELQLLKRCGVELRDVLVYCTMLGAWVIDGNQSKPRNLNSLAKRYGIVDSKEEIASKFFNAGLTVNDMPKSWLLSYCFKDVALTHKVFLKQREELFSLNLQHIAYMRNLTCACLADIEFNGMTLDADRVKDEYNKLTAELKELEIKLHEISGGVNLGSPKQLAVLLYEVLKFDPPKDHKGKAIRTEKGALSTNAKTLALLKPNSSEQKEFLEYYKRYNKLASLLEKNLEFFSGVVKEYNAKFHAVFNQGVTATHRLSSSGIPLAFSGLKRKKSVQFQNLPREYKKLFVASKSGFVLVEGDGAQLEFRVAADICNDALAMEEVANGVDIHTNTMNALKDGGFSIDRQGAKSFSFKPLYGGMGRAGTPDGAYFEFFKNKYEGISETQRGWTLKVLNDKYLLTRYGLRFYWPDTKMDRSGYVTNTTSIYNYPVNLAASA
jgi:DNA polymerase-1